MWAQETHDIFHDRHETVIASPSWLLYLVVTFYAILFRNVWAYLAPGNT